MQVSPSPCEYTSKIQNLKYKIWKSSWQDNCTDFNITLFHCGSFCCLSSEADEPSGRQRSERLRMFLQRSERLGMFLQRSKNLRMFLQISERLILFLQISERLRKLLQRSERLRMFLQRSVRLRMFLSKI